METQKKTNARLWLGVRVVVCALGVNGLIWLYKPDESGAPLDATKSVAIGALITLMLMRIWFALRISGSEIKKRYQRRDIPQILLTLAFLAPVIWVLTPLFDFADYASSSFALYGGAVLYLAGLFVCYRAHADLGKGLSPTLDIKKDHELITTGIYQRIRHPMYFGFLLFSIGQLLVVSNFVAGLAGIIGTLQLLVFRLPNEERMLLDEFGDSYAEYVSQTKRFIPGIW